MFPESLMPLHKVGAWQGVGVISQGPASAESRSGPQLRTCVSAGASSWPRPSQQVEDRLTEEVTDLFSRLELHGVCFAFQ